MEDYKVYVHICPNEKRYYGSTKQDVNKRWQYGYGYERQPRFWEDIQKYGWSNIQHIIVAKGLTKEEAYWLEEELIKTWDTTNPNKGYNISSGQGGKDIKRSEYTKKKISENHANVEGKNNPRYGKHGKDNPTSKSVICLTTKRIFYSIVEGAEYYEISSTGNIIKCCQGKLKSAGKYNRQKLVWRYFVWEHSKTYRIKQRV